MLLSLLLDYEPLFDGTLGDWNRPPNPIKLKDGAKPYHGRAIPVPKIHKDVLIKEVERLCKLGVLERQHYSEWASPSFIVPKKNGENRYVLDYRALNANSHDDRYTMRTVDECIAEIVKQEQEIIFSIRNLMSKCCYFT